MTLPEAAPAPMRPVSGGGVSMRPAMIVLALAVLILGVFVAAGILTSGPVQTTGTSRASSLVPGTAIRAVPAASDLKVITASGEPPSNILNSVAIPRGATRVSHQDNGGSADQFDAQIGLVYDGSQGAVNDFYLHDMKAQGWQIFATGPADHSPGAIEVLGKKGGSDGFYWEMGAVISPTAGGPHAPSTGTTSFTVRLFQVPDPD